MIDVAIYAVAVVLAWSGLASLMTQRSQQRINELVDAEVKRREDAQLAAQALAEAERQLEAKNRTPRALLKT